jgi:hypothetical protein
MPAGTLFVFPSDDPEEKHEGEEDDLAETSLTKYQDFFIPEAFFLRLF